MLNFGFPSPYNYKLLNQTKKIFKIDKKNLLDSFSLQCVLYAQSWLEFEPRPKYKTYVLDLAFDEKKIKSKAGSQAPIYLESRIYMTSLNCWKPL